MPSNLKLYTVSGYFSLGILCTPSEPCSSTWSTSSGNSLTGVVSVSLNFLRMVAISLKIQMSRYSPSGAMAPRLMLSDRSGTTESVVISSICPRPLHTGQAP